MGDGDEEQRDQRHRQDGLEGKVDQVGVGFFGGEDDVGCRRREVDHGSGRADGCR